MDQERLVQHHVDMIIDVGVLYEQFREQLDKSSSEYVAEYLQHNEYGLALELLCCAIEKSGVSISGTALDEIARLASKMSMLDGSSIVSGFLNRHGANID